MPADFLFLIPTTPENLLDDQRSELQLLCFNQILKLKSSRKVWILGDSKFQHDDFEVHNINASSKEDKLFLAGKKLESLKEPPAKNLVRLDDDDLINPEIFDKLSRLSFDIAYDTHHWFYDLSSGLTSSQKRAWIPNTAIHRMDMAMEKVHRIGGSELSGKENYLFACDHSRAWQAFYEGKKVAHSNRENPLYLRILNNSSRTARHSAGDESKNEYFRYLKTFGNWEKRFPLKSSLKRELLEIGQLGGRSLESWNFPKPSFLQKIKSKIRG